MNSRARFFLALWLIASSSIGSPAPCVADAPLTLREQTEVRHGVVRLSDLFNGVPADIDRDIAQAPPQNKPAVYDANVLTKLAGRYGLDWHAQTPADHVIVTSICTRITEDAIRKAIAQKIEDEGVKGSIDVSFDGKMAGVNLPADQSPDFTLGNFEYDQLGKRFHTELITESSQGQITLPLAGRVVVKIRVPVLVRRLEGGTVIGSADIDWINVPEERVGDAVVTDAGQIVGRELRRNTLEGDLLHINDVIPPRLVTRGGLVNMKIETPFMTLTAQGKALQDGAQGETVRVINTQSNRMIEGIVDGPGTVVVPTAQKLAAAQ
jgi:flagella basal body P-ring formation protein FlgA